MTGREPRRRERRSHRIPVRFTYQELAIARQRAHIAARPLARYLREIAIGRTPRSRRRQPRDDVAHALSTTIRQLTDNAGADPAATIALAVATLRTLLSHLAT